MRVLTLTLLGTFMAAAPAAASESVNVAPFHAVGLKGGGEVVVRPGATQSVTLIEGRQQYTRFTVHDGSLSIENCPSGSHCPMVYKVRIVITVPALTALAVSEGGSLRAEGAFPEQRAIAAAVNEGGIVDARSIPGLNVTAAVNQGGRVLVTARTSLTAAVNEGGSITYWGDPSSVTKSIHDGGAIARADGDDRHGAASRPAHTRTVTVVHSDEHDGDDADYDEPEDVEDMDDAEGMDEDSYSDDDDDE